MFKIGDKVRVNERCVEDDGHRYHGMVGKGSNKYRGTSVHYLYNPAV